MSSKIQQIPVWRACEDCRYRRRKCPHGRAVLLPLKAGGPDATFRPVTDPALIALAVSPPKVRKAPTPNKKRRRVSGERVKARRKAVKEYGGEWDEGGDREEGRKEIEEVKTGEELHGTISVRHFPQMPIQYNPSQRQGTPPKYLPLELGSMEKSKEKPDIMPTASQNGGGERLNLAPKTDYRTNERPGADTSKRVDKVLEDRLADQTAEKEGKNCSDSLDEETAQLAIALAIKTNSHHHHHSLGNAKEVGKTIKVPKHSKEPLEEHEEDEIPQQSSHQDFTSSGKTGFYQPSIHTGLLHNEDSELKLGQEPQLELELHRPEPTTLQLLEPQSPTPSIEFTHLAQSPRPQRPQLPLTPASINLTPPPLPPAHPISSLASTGAGSASLSYAAGPARWKLPCAKKSRFSGPKIYTPLTLHPPSGGLGVVDSKTLLRKDEVDIRWERAKRQISEEL